MRNPESIPFNPSDEEIYQALQRYDDQNNRPSPEEVKETLNKILIATYESEKRENATITAIRSFTPSARSSISYLNYRRLNADLKQLMALAKKEISTSSSNLPTTINTLKSTMRYYERIPNGLSEKDLDQYAITKALKEKLEQLQQHYARNKTN